MTITGDEKWENEQLSWSFIHWLINFVYRFCFIKIHLSSLVTIVFDIHSINDLSIAFEIINFSNHKPFLKKEWDRIHPISIFFHNPSVKMDGCFTVCSWIPDNFEVIFNIPPLEYLVTLNIWNSFLHLLVLVHRKNVPTDKNFDFHLLGTVPHDKLLK